MLFYSFSFMVICCYSSDRKLIQPQPLQGSPRPACPHATLEEASPLPHCSEPPCLFGLQPCCPFYLI